jgi:hypothetical protein
MQVRSLATTVQPVDEAAASRAGVRAVHVIMRRSAANLGSSPWANPTRVRCAGSSNVHRQSASGTLLSKDKPVRFVTFRCDNDHVFAADAHADAASQSG